MGQTNTEPDGQRPDVSQVVRVRLGGVPVDLCHESYALSLIAERVRQPETRPLAVVSVNLDHIHHFGESSPLAGSFGIREGTGSPLEWLHLIDGAPIASMARRSTGRDWPRLAGSDLLTPIMRNAERDCATVGFLGGTGETHERLQKNLARDFPRLRVGGVWAPSREELLDADRSSALAEEVSAAHVEVLAVCLGKPRQEVWIDHYGPQTRARVLLAFGAAADFLAGRVSRAPEWVSSHGLEWAWRLRLEPRRLAKRYLVQAPVAYRRLRRTPVLIAPEDQGA